MDGKHNKFCYENLTRKVKLKLFAAILSILNSSTKETETIDFENIQGIVKNINVNSNKALLKSKSKYIFSNIVCKKAKNYGFDFNKNSDEKSRNHAVFYSLYF